MNRRWPYLLLGIVVLVPLGILCAKPLSQAIATRQIANDRFIVYASARDVRLIRTLAGVLEKDYGRLEARYGSGRTQPVGIHVFTSNLLYNMAFGNPLPLPRAAGGYTGQSVGHDIYVLVRSNWQPPPDSIIPPDRTRTLCVHEMAHAFVYRLNPAVRGWITEGVATYEQTPIFTDAIRKVGFTGWIERDIRQGSVPRFARLFDGGTKITDRAITRDYAFAGTFVDYAVARHGYPALVAFIKAPDFVRAFGRSEDEIWKEWVGYLKEKYL
jgi:hypothetical protein